MNGPSLIHRNYFRAKLRVCLKFGLANQKTLSKRGDDRRRHGILRMERNRWEPQFRHAHTHTLERGQTKMQGHRVMTTSNKTIIWLTTTIEFPFSNPRLFLTILIIASECWLKWNKYKVVWEDCEDKPQDDSFMFTYGTSLTTAQLQDLPEMFLVFYSFWLL